MKRKGNKNEKGEKIRKDKKMKEEKTGIIMMDSRR